MSPASQKTFPLAPVLVGYLAVCAAVGGGLWWARGWALRELGSPEARAEWQEWKRHVIETQPRDDATVKWRVPKSDEPPLLVLLRDSFPGVAVGCGAIASFLYIFLVIVIRGAAAKPAD